MTRPKYGYFMRDGTDGYLYLHELGAGSQGSTALVRCVNDGQIYVRKKTLPIHGPNEGVHNCEVSLYRPYSLIPTLIDWHELEPLDDIQPQSKKLKSTVMIFKFCNGGSLREFWEQFADKGEPIPEPLIWQFVSQMFRVVTFLHRSCIPSVIHYDICQHNVFVHWPDGEGMPDFYLGDFGHAHIADIRVRPDHEPTSKEIEKYWTDVSGDVSDIGACLLHLLYTGRNDCLRSDEATAAIYSPELLKCLERLQDIGLDGLNAPEVNDIVDELRNLADAKVQAHKDSGGYSFAHMKPVRKYKPTLFDSPEVAQYSVFRPSGPWSIAKVNPETLEILEVEEKQHRTYEPFPNRHVMEYRRIAKLNSP